MDVPDTCMTISVACMFTAMMAYGVGMVCVPTVLCVIGAGCVVAAYHSYAADKPKKRKRKRR